MKIEKDSENIEEYTFEDFKLEGYNPHEALKMKMAVWSVCCKKKNRRKPEKTNNNNDDAPPAIARQRSQDSDQ